MPRPNLLTADEADKKIGELIAALEKIAKPEGAWNNDKEIYYKNVIMYCVDIAKQALSKAKGETQ